MYKLHKSMRIIVLGCLCLVFVGCSYSPYRYSFSLIDPLSETMKFEDRSVQFMFVPSPENIHVVIKNKTDHDINLVRDNAEYISPLGESRRIHYGYDYVGEVRSFTQENYQTTPPLRIESGSEIEGHVWLNIWPDFCIGQGRHSITTAQINYLMEPLFPRYRFEGQGEDLKDSTFTLIMPIDIDGHVSNYTFTFMINDVVE
jgi:hypothetical protein